MRIGNVMVNKLPHSKLVSAEQAIAGIQPGSHVFVGTACATPRALVKALEESNRNLVMYVFTIFSPMAQCQ